MLYLLLITRSSLKELQREVSSASRTLKTADSTVVEVMLSLKKSRLTIDSVIADINRTKTSIDRLSATSRALTAVERERLRKSGEELEATNHLLGLEKAEAEDLIELLNNTKGHE